MTNAAIQLNTEPYDAAIPRPMGRNSAGEGFLRGLLAYADVDAFHFWNVHGQDQSELEALIARLGGTDRPVRWIGRGDRREISASGALYIPTPELRAEAWARRSLGGGAYSLTGITHSIAETYILDEMAAMLLAPLEPWDALICTSDAGRRAVESLLEGVAVYLQERFGATRIPPAQLVTIPLGIHALDFGHDPEARRGWRDTLGIPQDALVALHVGRFSLTTKMHPAPMGLALQQAAQRLGRPVYWVLFGGARKIEEEQAFQVAAAALAPDVHIRLAGDTSADTRNSIFSVADVFLSLADNLQETFGLTPVEAMAAGLPCVVSDWDGYRDTVRDGVDGFRIRTLQPRPGLGADLVYAYAQRLTTYEDYAGATALLTSIDVGQTADALVALFADPELRARMGAAGQERARSVFDWRAIIPQYQALWGELARRRRASPGLPALENPYRPDPFRMFAGYPSAALSATDVVALSRPFAPGEALFLMETPTLRSPAARLPTAPEFEAVLAMLEIGPAPVGEILRAVPADRRPFMERGLLWLAKFGFVRLDAALSRN
ncbi:MAG: glycosyltransferase family 4 protein [Phenylobacterium sp.]|nr:glycosyltransferase family 4 protein [Phenylobacterium sp.]